MRHQNKNISDYKRLRHLFNSGAVFTAIYTETTSLTPNTGRIIEIGAIKFTKDKVLGSWCGIFNPNQKLSPFITNLTHITQQMVNFSDYIDVHLPDFLSFIKDTVLIAHNAQFDINFLKAECEKSNLPVIKNQVADTLKLSRIIFPDFARYRLDFLADMFSIDKGSSHRAYDDAKVCMQLFKICMDKEKYLKTN